MENELRGCSGRKIDADSSNTMPNDHNYENKDMRNISVQTGEEFSPEFLRDRFMSRRMPFANNDVNQIPTSEPVGDAIQNQHLVYKDVVTGFPGTRRNDSENCTGLYPSKGYGGFDVDHKTYLDGSSTYHRELQASAQHQRKLSEDFDKGSPSAISICSSDSPNSKGSRMLDRTLSGKIKFLCSFGGRILPRPNDAKLRYVGGDTRIISIRKDLAYNELVKKTTTVCNYHHTIKYQLPGEDLDALISVSSDEDLHHMIEEYHDLERKSQRLRLFLVSTGDLEGPSSSETRGRQKNDPDYQYVVAVNGISPHRSSSRESLESQWMNNLEGSPTVQKENPNSFRHFENQNGAGSSLNPKLMLSSPSTPIHNAPEIPPPFSPAHFKDPKTYFVKTYENVACPYVYTNNCPYIVDSPGYDNTGFVDGPGYYYPNNPIDNNVSVIGSPNQVSHIVQSHAGSHFRKPSNEFQYPLPHSPNYSDARKGFVNVVPLHSEKLVPCQDTFSFSLVSDIHAKSCNRVSDIISESQPANERRDFSLEHEKEKTSLTFATENLPSSLSQDVVDQHIEDEKYQISGNKNQPFQEPPNLNKDHIEWGRDTLNWMNNKEISFEQHNAINNDYASNTQFWEHKHNLPQIICHPENYQISPSESEFLIRSQKAESGPKHDALNAIDYNTTFFGCHGLQPVGGKENNNQSRPVQLPGDEYSLGLYSNGPLVLPETTTNYAFGGEISAQKEIVNVCYERMNDFDGSVKKEKADLTSYKELNIKNDAFVNSRSSDNFHDIHVPEKPVVDVHSEGIESPGEEAESVTYASEDDDDKVDDVNKDESMSDSAIIEMEASIYGLQIIRYADVEELQELGSGTFGTVYHGKWRGTDVAIKRIKKSCFAGGSSEQERLTKDFWREAKILSRLHHPNIVAFYGVVPDGPGGTLATVTEYMANGSLRHVLLRKDKALDRRKKVIIALDASFGMEYLHLKNIVHFDLKCDNLLVNLGDSQRPVCKVADFGLSRIKQNTLVSGGVRGTLPWMAPELLNGNSSRVSEKVDVFSFGIAMWEIFTGEEPYLDMHCGAIIGGIVNNTLRPPIPEQCDREWKKLMEECWSHDPAARPSFTEITKRLQVMSTALQPKRLNRVKR